MAAALALAFSSYSLSVWAQSPDAPRLLAQATLPTVTVEAQRTALRERQTDSVARLIVDEAEVERFGDATVGDVLRRLPGMSFTGPAGVVKDIRIRGLDKGYTQFLINGEPVPSATKERQFQVDRLPADMIERIEIVRNPSAAMDSDGVGGAINIVLKQTADNLTRLRAAYGRNGSLEVGDVVAQWSRKLGDLDVVLALSHTVGAEDIDEEKEKFSAAGGLTEREIKPKPARKGETLLSPRLTWRNGKDRLTLDAFLSEGTEEKNEASTFSNSDGSFTKGSDKFEDKDDAVWRLGTRYDGVAAWGTWFAKAGTQEARIDKDATIVERNAARRVSKRTLETEVTTDEARYTGAGARFALGDDHRISTGIELRDAAYDNRKDKWENGVDTSAIADQYRIEERRLIGYLEDEWKLGQRHWLTPGLRLEKVDRDATDGRGLTQQGDHTGTQPSLHYRWAFNDQTNVRASWSRTSRLPRFDQVNPLTTRRSGSLSDPDTAGNSDLRPERARGIELGFEHFFMDSRGLLGANLYHRDVSDFIQLSTAQEGSRFVQRPDNVSKAAFWGAEFDWRVPLIHKGPAELSFTGNHAELRGRVRNAGNGAETGVKDMPPRITTLGLDWTHRPSRWSIGSSVSLQPAFTTRSQSENGQLEVKSRNASTLLDVYVTKVFSARAEVRLVAKNVLSMKKREFTTVYRADGSFANAEARLERSHPTVYLTYESRF